MQAPRLRNVRHRGIFLRQLCDVTIVAAALVLNVLVALLVIKVQNTLWCPCSICSQLTGA